MFSVGKRLQLRRYLYEKSHGQMKEITSRFVEDCWEGVPHWLIKGMIVSL